MWQQQAPEWAACLLNQDALTPKASASKSHWQQGSNDRVARGTAGGKTRCAGGSPVEEVAMEGGDLEALVAADAHDRLPGRGPRQVTPHFRGQFGTVTAGVEACGERQESKSISDSSGMTSPSEKAVLRQDNRVYIKTDDRQHCHGTTQADFIPLSELPPCHPPG